MKPKMILFDYGQTLIVEPQFDAKRANLAVLQHASGHTNMTPDEICAFSEKLFCLLSEKVRRDCREIDDVKFQQLLYEYAGLTLDISYEQADLLFGIPLRTALLPRRVLQKRLHICMNKASAPA